MSKKKAYVIGTNVSTSLSPIIFQYWFNKHNIVGEYGYIETKEENFDQEIKSILKKEDLIGLNVTMPFKERILPYLTYKNNGEEGLYNHLYQNKSELNLEAHNASEAIVDISHIKKFQKERLGRFKKLNREIKLPINCVTIYKNKIVGTNTDRIGFEKAYLKHIEKTQNLSTGGIYDLALVLGYGGAAKGIVYSLVNMGFSQVVIFNRTYNKIKNINMFLEGTENVQNCEVRAEKIENLIKYTDYKNYGESQPKVIVNTTPTNPLNKNINWNIDTTTKGFDIVYRPRKGTGFLEHFDPNFRIEGIQMLVYQAAPCFKLWFGVEPEIDEGLFDVLYNKMDENK